MLKDMDLAWFVWLAACVLVCGFGVSASCALSMFASASASAGGSAFHCPNSDKTPANGIHLGHLSGLSRCHMPSQQNHFHAHSNSNSHSFPNSSSPVQLSPAVYLPSTVSCTLPIFQNVPFSGYGPYVKNTFRLTDGAQPCPPMEHWAKLVLTFQAAVEGLQYDRFGAVWIGDVEVLRLTTPEPTPAGIQWSAQQDISTLAGYLLQLNTTNGGDIPAFINIPNVVDPTYTGIIYVNTTLTIYADSQFHWSESHSDKSVRSPIVPPLIDPPNVYSLTRAPSLSGDGLSAMSISGPEVFNYALPDSTFFIQRSYDGVPISAQRLYAVVFMSQHGCDEFYYTNAPTEYAQQLSGGCGGGSYREINVTIDGLSVPAAVSAPFETIYSGGINPLLWRPVAGIQSFALTPMYLDVTPFMGTLVDGAEHSLAIRIFPNDTGGNWFIDSSLFLYYSSTAQSAPSKHGGASVAQLIGGSVMSHKDSSPDVWLTVTGGPILPNPIPPITITTVAAHSVEVVGALIYANGHAEIVEINAHRQFSNVIFFPDLLTQVVNNSEHFQVERVSPSFSSVLHATYPMNLWYYYNQNSTTFDMAAMIDYSMKRSKRVHKQAQPNAEQLQFGFDLDDRIVSAANYNRTLDSKVIYLELDTANEQFHISTNNGESVSVSVAAHSQSDSHSHSLSLSHSHSHSHTHTGTRPTDSAAHVHMNSQYGRGQGQGNPSGRRSPSDCYVATVAAINGTFTANSVLNSCNDVLPSGVALCGYDVCGLY